MMNSDELITKIKEIAFTDSDSILTSLRNGYTLENQEKNEELKNLFTQLNKLLVTQKQIEREQFGFIGEILSSLATFIGDDEWIIDFYYELSSLIYKDIYNTQF